ncbi:hypothetical protein L950_0214775 [Sphingobacterium sp. IITKGP-BTPF85]|nr:hypothetical protein L950_0214775 [Sphingobacterium sp. IITKGP-BTPF85]
MMASTILFMSDVFISLKLVFLWMMNNHGVIAHIVAPHGSCF